MVAASVLLVVGTARPALAQTAPEVQQVRDELARLKTEFEALRQQYNERLFALEQKLSQIGGPSGIESSKSSGSSGSPTSPQAPTPQTPAQVAPASSKIFNPDTSVIANFLGAAGRNPFSPLPAMQLSEAEVSFQAIVDPYARADFFLSASPEGLEVEEGYITFMTLPGKLLLKTGKMRAQFGKVNTLHTHALPTADRPLVTDNLVGGEEGLSDAGMSLSHLILNPALFLEVTGEVYTGDDAVFQSPGRSKLAYVGRVRGYRDLTDSMNIDLGTSYAFGPTDVPPAALGDPVLNKQLFGIDATFRYRPPQRAIYKRLNLRSELIWSKQDLPLGESTDAFGFYGLGEYQFAQRWYVGGRYDRSGRVLDGTLHDQGGSVFMTFWPSEFSQIRGQLRRTRYAEGIVANEFLFQFNFSIGAHGAHVF
jgi:hypothetical protein